MTFSEIVARAKATYASGIKPCVGAWGDGCRDSCLVNAASNEWDVDAASEVLGINYEYTLGLIDGWDANKGVRGDGDYERGTRDGKRARKLFWV